MKKLFLFTLIFTSFIFPQLKEMEVKPTENRGGIPIFRDYPDKAGIIFYTQFDNLSFYSSSGIADVKGDPSGGKYVVIIVPVWQSIELRVPGFKTEMIKLNDLKPRDVLYYEVLLKKEGGITGVTEVGVTVQVIPKADVIKIDGESFPHNRTKKLSIGKHRLKVEKKNYVTYDEEIIISTDITLFQIELKYDVASTMVKVEGGTFTMGSNEGNPDEKPEHQVTLNSFMIGKYEVTQELWESVMGNNPSYYKGSNRPIDQLSWYDVIDFCNILSEIDGLTPAYTINKNNKDLNNENSFDEEKWTVTCDFTVNGYRLPTEAEWEYAAKGGSSSKGYVYSGSNNFDAVAWYDENYRDTSHNNVGTKKPNELGIYDMSGNVYEWCWDWYGDYQSGSQTDPKGANSGSDRVWRSGVGKDDQVTRRFFARPGFDRYGLSPGFRLVRTN